MYIFQLVLAIVFCVAGLTKLSDVVATRQTIVNFGLPNYLVRVLVWLLPTVEIGISVALIFSETGWLGTVGAVTLLSTFNVVILVNIAQGKRPECHCFGNLHSAPIGWRTLVRNSLLTMFAVIALSQFSGTSAFGPSIAEIASQVSIQIIILLLFAFGILCMLGLEGWLIFHLIRQNGRLILRMDALEMSLVRDAHQKQRPEVQTKPTTQKIASNKRAPELRVHDFDGGIFTLDTLREKQKPMMLIFSDPKCGPCNALLPDISRWQRDFSHLVNVVIISSGSVEANRIKGRDHNLTNIYLQKDREVAQAYGVYGTPGAVLVSPHGLIWGDLAMGGSAIAELISEIVQDARIT